MLPSPLICQIQHFLQLFLSAAIEVIFQLVFVLHQLNSPRSPLNLFVSSHLHHYEVGCGLNICETVLLFCGRKYCLLLH